MGTQVSVLCSPTIMKIYVALLMVLTVAVSGKRKGKEDHGTIIRCMAESYWSGKGEDTIKACRECFKGVGNPLSEEGLPKAKECTRQFLPKENEACASLIAELTPNDMEKGGEVIECFDETLEAANYQRCIEESSATEVNEVLTDGAMCVLKSWKFGHDYVKNVTRQARPARGRFQRRRGRGRGKGKKGAFMKMLMVAHCETANDNDESSADCQKCFKTAVKNTRRQSKADMKAAMADCSEKHLAPLYDSCTTMMRSEAADKGETFKCYQRVLLGNLVSQCSEGISEATTDSLDTVMDCGKEQVMEFVKENASPSMLKKLGEMFGEDSSEEEDDED